MPADLRSHVRYPEEIFRIQAQVYTLYHMTSPPVFYTKEDQWQWPIIDSAQNPTLMQPYYTIMRLPGERKNEFIQMLPFTPRAKDNLSAWMVARSDGEHYGRLLVFQFPKEKLVFGPRQIAGRINQDKIISQQVTLWNQQGSEVVWGTLLVIPIDESLLYIRPMYLRSQAKIPELKNVVVAYQNQIVMAETLRQALIQIFGPSVAAALPVDRLQFTGTTAVPAPVETPATRLPAAPGLPAGPESVESLISEAQLHRERMNKALRDGDLAAFGEEWKRLQATLDRLARVRR
jgi:uncharacterized membrane protein (UPF0182 family)